MSAMQTAEVVTHSIKIIDKLIGRRTAGIIVDCLLHAMTHIQTVQWKLD